MNNEFLSLCVGHSKFNTLKFSYIESNKLGLRTLEHISQETSHVIFFPTIFNLIKEIIIYLLNLGFKMPRTLKQENA